MALGRITAFFGLAIPVLTLAGIVIARRRVERSVFAILAAYGFTFFFLTLLRGAQVNVFRDVQDLLFVSPFVAVTTGVCLEALADRGWWGRLAAVLVTSGLVLFGMAKYRGYLDALASLAGLDGA
jgi:hypothetical protein